MYHVSHVYINIVYDSYDTTLAADGRSGGSEHAILIKLVVMLVRADA